MPIGQELEVTCYSPLGGHLMILKHLLVELLVVNKLHGNLGPTCQSNLKS